MSILYKVAIRNIAIYALIIAAVVWLASLVIGSADAKKDDEPDEVKKVFVCKYVGTPGEDEVLQTGQNPINVSINSIKDYEGVGSYFNDAQGRSYVLAEDTGQEEPDVSECPDGDTPEEPEEEPEEPEEEEQLPKIDVPHAEKPEQPTVQTQQTGGK